MRPARSASSASFSSLISLINDGAFNAFHAQFVFEGACAAWAELSRFSTQNEAKASSLTRSSRSSRARVLNHLGGRLFAAQVAAHLLATARAIREKVIGTSDRLLQSLFVAQLLQLRGEIILAPPPVPSVTSQRHSPQQKATIHEDIDAFSILNLWLKTGNFHSVTIPLSSRGKK